MVISQNRGTPIQTPKYYNPYYGDPKKVPLILGNSHIGQQEDTFAASTSLLLEGRWECAGRPLEVLEEAWEALGTGAFQAPLQGPLWPGIVKGKACPSGPQEKLAAHQKKE